MAVINESILRKELEAQLPGMLQAIAFERSSEYLAAKKQEFLDKFENDPVTRELEEGPESNGGLLPKGNLFGFIVGLY